MRLNRRGDLDPVLKHLDQAFDLVVESPPRKRALRCSALPYCPILDALLPEEPDRGDLSGALYMSIGTAMHSAMQAFMSMAPSGSKMWGSWRCPKCGKVVENAFRPADCCDLPVQYVEASLRVACMTGHVDFIARYKLAHGGHRWVLLDF